MGEEGEGGLRGEVGWVSGGRGVAARSGIGVMGMCGLDHWLGDATMANVTSSDRFLR